MTIYVPGTEEKDPKKVIMSLQQIGPRLATAETDIDTNTADIATNTANIATKVTGPGSSTDNALVRYDGTTGKIVQNSEITLGDSDGKLTRSAGISVSGTNTNDSAASGYIGEYGSSSVDFASRVSLTSTTAASLTSLSIPAGDFDVVVRLHFEPAATTSVTRLIASLSATNNTLDQTYNRVSYLNMAASVPVSTISQTVARARVSQASTTTWYAVARADFTVSTMQVWGGIEYRRVR